MWEKFKGFLQKIHPFPLPLIGASIGMFVCVLVLVWSNGLPAGGPFTDLRFSGKTQAMDSVLARRIRQLQAPHPTAGRIALLQKLLTRQYRLAHGNTDTSLATIMKPLSAPRESIQSAIETVLANPHTEQSYPVTFWLWDTLVLKNTLPQADTITLSLVRHKWTTSLVNYFNVYPQFGLWFVLTVAQVTLWCLIVPLFLGQILNLASKPNQLIGDYTVGNLGLSCLSPAFCTGLFCIQMYCLVLAPNPLIQHYFMQGFSGKIVPFALLGYLTAVVCFGIYIFLANRLDDLNKQATMEGGAAPDPNLQASFDTLKRTFNGVFLATALILSLFVWWIGALFNGINNMDAMRVYTLYAGRPFFCYDLVYLMGLMHSLLLLIFYVPAKLKFSSMALNKTSTAGQGAGGKVAGGFIQGLGTVLVTTSPLLASFLQNFISGLSN